jgi:hypothetical protein
LSTVLPLDLLGGYHPNVGKLEHGNSVGCHFPICHGTGERSFFSEQLCSIHFTLLAVRAPLRESFDDCVNLGGRILVFCSLIGELSFVLFLEMGNISL